MLVLELRQDSPSHYAGSTVIFGMKAVETHVCACFAKLLSIGSGFTLVLSFSLSNSTRSMPEDPSQSLLLLPESEVNDGTTELAGVLPLGGESATRP